MCVCVFLLASFLLKSCVRTVTSPPCLSDSEANGPGDSSRVKILGIRGRTIGRGVWAASFFKQKSILHSGLF